MLFPSQNSMQSFTIRSIDVQNSSKTLSDQNSTLKRIQQNYIHNVKSLLPNKQPRHSFHSFQSRDPTQQTPQTTKHKPYSQSIDNQSSQQVGLIQNYLGSHNKFKTYFKGKKYKKIYQELAKQLPLEKSYFCLYMQDKFYALNKHIKVSLVHKETSFEEYLGPYFDAGKNLIKEFYRYFLIDDQLYNGSQKVNTEVITTGSFGKSSNVCHFLYLTVTFLYQLAIFYRSKNQRHQAKLYYQANLKIVYKIFQSSTSSSSIRRKISQYLISFSSFLIESRQFIKAQRILQIALQNCINLIAIIQTKLKYSFKGKNPTNEKDITYERFKKRTNLKLKQAFQLMMAIYLNSAVLFQLQNKEHLSYLALNEVRHIEQILYKNWSIKMKTPQVIKKPKQTFDYQHQKIHIVKCYFDIKAILKKKLQQKKMKYNENVAIYGLTKASQTSFIRSRDLMELFFDDEKKKQLRSEKRKMSIIANKIGLIEYDSRSQAKDNVIQPTFQYTINMKSINGSQQTAVYNEFQPPKQQPIQANKLSPEVVVRRDRKKLSKFYNIAMSQKQISIKESTNKKIDPNSIKEFKKSEKTYTTIKSQKMDPPQLTPQASIKQPKSQDKEMDFLNKLIDSQVSIKRYFLYGKDFVDKYDLLSKGKTLYTKKDKEKRQQKNNEFLFQSHKWIEYPTKNEAQILGFKGANAKGNGSKSNSVTLLHKKNRSHSRQPFNNLSENQSQKQPVYIVTGQKKTFQDELNSKDFNPRQENYKKRSSTSLKYEPMGYNQIMDKMEKIQNQFLKKDFIQKNSIYRLKCKSQNISRSKLNLTQMSTDCFSKNPHTGAIINSIKRQNQREPIMFKFDNTEKPKNLPKDQPKKAKLTKKALNSNMFSTSQTGIRLLKKLIFKHKKTLNITKPDLFVNYNKTEIHDQEIKLVERQSLLMVQYQMCEEQTKARIKQNMKQLIVDNIRNSEENEKRVQKLNKAISGYDKNRRINEYSAKMRREYDAKGNQQVQKLVFAHNPQYFAQTFSKKDQKKDSSTQQTDQILRKIFQKRIYQSQTDSNPLGLNTNQKFLTGNKIQNPNLFLSSIKYKQEEKQTKKMKTVKNINKAEKENKVLDDSELQDMEEENNGKKNAIEKFLAMFQAQSIQKIV